MNLTTLGVLLQSELRARRVRRAKRLGRCAAEGPDGLVCHLQPHQGRSHRDVSMNVAFLIEARPSVRPEEKQ
jgi:hypothetical protein